MTGQTLSLPTSKPKITNFRFLMNATDSGECVCVCHAHARGRAGRNDNTLWLCDCFNCNCSQFKSWRRDMSAFWIRLLVSDPAPRSATHPFR